MVSTEEYGITIGQRSDHYIGIRRYTDGRGLLIFDGPRDSNLHVRAELTAIELREFLKSIEKLRE